MSRVDAARPEQPLRALWRRHRRYRGGGSSRLCATTVNKVADVMPELLIGAAVDVVVPSSPGWQRSMPSSGSSSPSRSTARTGIGHELRVEAYDHAQHLEMARHESRSSGSTLATLNDDVNQLERFLNVGAPAILQTS